MSLTDVLMILLILTIRCRGDLDSMLIENITLLNYDLDWFVYDDWINRRSLLIKWDLGLEPVGRLDWIGFDLGVEE